MSMRSGSRVDDRARARPAAGEGVLPGEKRALGAWFAACAQTDRLNTTHMTTNINKKVFGCMGTGNPGGDDPHRKPGWRAMACLDYRPNSSEEV